MDVNTNLIGLAAVLTALLTPLSVVAVGWINSRKIDRVQAIATETLEKTAAVDAAVNGKRPGVPTISQDVSAIRDKQEIDNPTVKDQSEADAVLPILKELAAAVATIQMKLSTKEQG